MLALTGCSRLDAALRHQVAVVKFKPDTPARTVLQVGEACAHVPGMRQEPATVSTPAPMTPGATAAPKAGVLRYDASNATVADLAALHACLDRFSVVAQVAIPVR